MKALSLWQPWATLIALGVKLTETRGKPIRYTGPLAIHAAKLWNRRTQHAAREFADEHPQFREELVQPPRGGIVALADVVEVYQFGLQLPDYVTAHDYHAGNFTAGRWGYKLENVRAVHPMVPLPGHQWLWTLTPEEAALVLSRAERQHVAWRCKPGDGYDCARAWCATHHGELFLCETCGQAEGELTPFCPGPVCSEPSPPKKLDHARKGMHHGKCERPHGHPGDHRYVLDAAYGTYEERRLVW